MAHAFTSTAAPPPAGTYSMALEAGGFVFLSGQTPRDRTGRRHGEASFAEQATMTMDNLESAAQAAGLSLKNAVKVTVYLQDTAYARQFDEIYARYVASPLPARTLVQSSLDGFALEVDAILHR